MGGRVWLVAAVIVSTAAVAAAGLLVWGVTPLSVLLLVVTGLLSTPLVAARLSMTRESRQEWTSWLFADGVRSVDRRTALRLFGVAAVFGSVSQMIPKVLNSALLQGTPPDTGELPARARTRQWTMMIDLRRCDGCQSIGLPPQCTTACIEGHFAPEPMQWIEVYEHELPGDGTRFVPTPCQQCQNPPCVNVCPVGATFSAPEGTVLIDQDRCIGCRICMAACPYDRRFFNWGDPPVPSDALLAEYDLELQVPARKGTVMKCDFCPDMVRSGTLPYCIQACPHRAIYYGDLEEDLATNGKELVSVSRYLANNDAFRLKEELGTRPRVFYIPGHGEEVGRDPTTAGHLPIRWPWTRLAEGSARWSR
jgi:molybdopterin-containing oxidoreductase family iron-sulfur binding subunit